MKFLNLNLDTNLGGDSASDVVISSQKAIKTYVDNNFLSKETKYGNSLDFESDTGFLSLRDQNGDDICPPVDIGDKSCIPDFAKDDDEIEINEKSSKFTITNGNKIFVKNGTSLKGWEKEIVLKSPSEISLDTEWYWENGEKPEFFYNDIIFASWNGLFGILILKRTINEKELTEMVFNDDDEATFVDFGMGDEPTYSENS